MKIYWSPKRLPDLPLLDYRQVLARWHAVASRCYRHGQSWLGLLAGALLAALARSVGLGSPGSLLTALLAVHCYAQAGLYLARRACRRLLRLRAPANAEDEHYETAHTCPHQ
ncbi:hypothetical protein RB25_18670 [Herbaspirillum rubrisubalbicans]|uniref:Uncharacterized protein n=2 Tax=Herbaspirillum rubrisubalbicans TaxID=80842 RepID=A0ABX9C5D3_9BURK|nr:hypothetical protein [Herbaspirillum rubrisubalbicans]MCP1574502.1 hypothetical protein [Herbaspirillum rubrisubalbicans]QJQ02974.1 hypothetical protein C798_22925 [Herbaspirillum rubrisubalbicans Os34]RAM65801.1 hypothetical protein RB24_04700 [Herbaspirillum rubrisubalbicans]RAN45187.1 hypothetical protein RB25_18670 [Herbaspirillum rubrisubalbicans]